MVGERTALTRFVFALVTSAALVGCRRAPHPAPQAALDPEDQVAAELTSFEDARRRATDFATVPPWPELAGADPYRISPLAPPGAGAAGILRGTSSLVLLDASLRERQRVDAPHGTTGLAVLGDQVVVSGEGSPVLARFRVEKGALVPAGRITLEGVTGLRDVALGKNGFVYAVDTRAGTLVALETDEASWKNGAAKVRRDFPAGIAPFRVLATPTHLVVDDLLGHSLLFFDLDARGAPRASDARIRHDGPIFGFDAREVAGDLIVVAGGVEDRALDRRQGFFGFVDSFAFLYRVHEGVASRLAELDVSELGVVTPKAVAIDAAGADVVSALVLGYGGDRGARVTWRNSAPGAPPVVTTFPVLPGTTAIARVDAHEFLLSSTLLDSWGTLRPEGFSRTEPVPNGAPRRSAESRVGEALFFTTLMAPGATSDGAHSRFTCETCHFEGYVDGRTHFTGRENVYATTKPLRGLFDNRPHFSRALDPDLATVAMNELRVANAGTGTSEWFTLNQADFPWIRDLDPAADVTSPLDLRRALMSFLMDFSHDENPRVRGRSAFTEEERAGAASFRDRCESCHEARTASDVATSRLPFEAWKHAIFSPSEPIVWARATYEKTGVVPYVHESGARVPSLRRLEEKRPYFTNGSAADLEHVLDRARFAGGTFFHDGAPPGAASLPESERRALASFLVLL